MGNYAPDTVLIIDCITDTQMSRLIPYLLIVTLMSGCVYFPKTTEVYSAECRTQFKHMSLTSEEMGAFFICRHDACIALLVLAGVVSAGSAVVSGSVVVVGKAVYWLENQINCNRSPDAGEPRQHDENSLSLNQVAH